MASDDSAKLEMKATWKKVSVKVCGLVKMILYFSQVFLLEKKSTNMELLVGMVSL